TKAEPHFCAVRSAECGRFAYETVLTSSKPARPLRERTAFAERPVQECFQMKQFFVAVLAASLCACALAQDAPQGGRVMMPGNMTAGTIKAIKGDTITLQVIMGGEATVKLTDKTEFRMGQGGDAAKLADFKVGDMVAIR